jgi:hypothetical protein
MKTSVLLCLAEMFVEWDVSGRSCEENQTHIICPVATFRNWYRLWDNMEEYGRLLLKCDGTRWRTEGEVKGKQENGVGNQ